MHPADQSEDQLEDLGDRLPEGTVHVVAVETACLAETVVRRTEDLVGFPGDRLEDHRTAQDLGDPGMRQGVRTDRIQRAELPLEELRQGTVPGRGDHRASVRVVGTGSWVACHHCLTMEDRTGEERS